MQNNLLAAVMLQKYIWSGHVLSSSVMPTTILQGAVKGEKKGTKADEALVRQHQ